MEEKKTNEKAVLEIRVRIREKSNAKDEEHIRRTQRWVQVLEEIQKEHPNVSALFELEI